MSQSSAAGFVIPPWHAPQAYVTTRNRIQPLADLPLMGSELAGRSDGLRLILGPWVWMPIICSYDREKRRANVLNIEDARMADSATSQERTR